MKKLMILSMVLMAVALFAAEGRWPETPYGPLDVGELIQTNRTYGFYTATNPPRYIDVDVVISWTTNQPPITVFKGVGPIDIRVSEEGFKVRFETNAIKDEFNAFTPLEEIFYEVANIAKVKTITINGKEVEFSREIIGQQTRRFKWAQKKEYLP